MNEHPDGVKTTTNFGLGMIWGWLKCLGLFQNETDFWAFPDSTFIYSFQKGFFLLWASINIKFPQTSFPYLKQAIMPLLKCWQASYKMVVTGAIMAKYLPKRTSLFSQYLSKASIFFYV